MTAEAIAPPRFFGAWVLIRAVFLGLLVGLLGANVITILERLIGISSLPRGVIFSAAGIVFLAVFLWWTRGGGPPRAWTAARAAYGRAGAFSGAQWLWAIVTGVAFATTIHALLVIVFRIVPYPVELFHRGYAEFGQIPTLPLKWFAVVLAASFAAITEETGFRGYMQQPIEQRYGAVVGIGVSTVFFVLAHLNQSWLVPAMMLVAAVAAVLLGAMARLSGSLIPGFISHTLMDIGLFAYWWTSIAGTFTAHTISETGIDAQFATACAIFVLALGTVLFSIAWLSRPRGTSLA